ncbi:MAG TPA: DUF1772 domain-containing protein [Thermoanaerobaculia bacterium]
MNRSIESVLRFVNVTAAGLLAGSLGFGDVALVPGWEHERPRDRRGLKTPPPPPKYFNAIGPVALATSLTLAIGSRNAPPSRRVLDLLSALGFAGVVGTTMLVTVPINRKLEEERPLDYVNDDSHALAKNWSRAQGARTALGVTAFLCAAASTVLRKTERRRP